MIKNWFTVFAILCLLLTGRIEASGALQDISGRMIPFSSLKGKWIFINYWASWCKPCLEEIPELNRFYEENKANHVLVFAINYEGLPVRDQKRLIKQFNIHYPSLQKDPASTLNLGPIRAVPATYVFSPTGTLKTTLYGPQTQQTLIEIIH